MKKAVFYLCGGMEAAVNLGAKWREVCSNELARRGYGAIDITALDVAYTAEHGHVYMDPRTPEELADPTIELQNKSNIRHQFIKTDIQLIRNDADGVIALYDEAFKNGAGSFAECQVTYDLGKPLYIVSTLPKVPSWLRALSTKIFANFDDLYAYLESLPDGVLKLDTYGNRGNGSHYLCFLCGEVFVKNKHPYVSTVSPLYCKGCVTIVEKTRKAHFDRYTFCEAEMAKDRQG